MLVIGVTGSVGTGKSTVAAMFARRGAVVLDADRIAHDVLQPGRIGWRRTVRAFGSKIVKVDRTIDRSALAQIVFTNAPARRKLEAIVHPLVLGQIRRELGRLRRAKARAVILDVPLLLETNAHRLVDAVIVVTARPAVISTRLRARGWTEMEIRRRRRAQWEVSAKEALADVVIDNSQGLATTRTQVTRVWQKLQNDARRPS